MMKKAPGKAYRKGITLKKIMQMFPDNATSEQWFIEQRWPTGVCCPECGSMNVQSDCKHKTMPYRCREKECGLKFSVKTGTVMEGSKIGYQDWIIAAFEIMTSPQECFEYEAAPRSGNHTENPHGFSPRGYVSPCLKTVRCSPARLKWTKRTLEGSGAT